MFCRLVFVFSLTVIIRGNVVTPMQKDDKSMTDQALKAVGQRLPPSLSHLSAALKNSGLPPSRHYYPTYPQYETSQYQLESGHGSYEVPATQVPPPLKGSSGWSSTIVSSLVPLGSFAFTYGARAAILVFHCFILLIIGIFLTTSICTFTPFCTITFDRFALNKNQVKEQVAELARAYITPESLNAATMLVKAAVETYAEMQRQSDGKTTGKNIDTVREKSEKRRRRK